MPYIAALTDVRCVSPQCALVIGALWLVGDVGVRKRVLKLLHQKGRTLASLRSVLLEYRANLGVEGGCCLYEAGSPPAGGFVEGSQAFLPGNRYKLGWVVVDGMQVGRRSDRVKWIVPRACCLPWGTRRQWAKSQLAMEIQQEI